MRKYLYGPLWKEGQVFATSEKGNLFVSYFTHFTINILILYSGLFRSMGQGNVIFVIEFFMSSFSFYLKHSTFDLALM